MFCGWWDVECSCVHFGVILFCHYFGVVRVVCGACRLCLLPLCGCWDQYMYYMWQLGFIISMVGCVCRSGYRWDCGRTVVV